MRFSFWKVVIALTLAGAGPLGAEEGVRFLELRPSEVSVDAKAGKARYVVDSFIMKAHYDSYLFDLAQWNAKVGTMKSKDQNIVLKVTMGDETQRTVTPGDPRMPAPVGGFKYTDTPVTILAVYVEKQP